MDRDQLNNLPVFNFPQVLHFPIDDPSHHKQIVTILNPYDFGIRFKLLATAPNKYRINCTTGTIRSRHYVDLMIRHLSINVNEIGATDHLRIEIAREGKLLGIRDIPMSVVQHMPSNVPDANMFRSFTNSSGPSESVSRQESVMGDVRSPRSGRRGSGDRGRGRQDPFDNRLLNGLVIFLVILCGLTMLIPTFNPDQAQPNPNEGIIGRLVALESRPTFSQQMLASFVMGASVVILFYQNLRI